MSEALWAELETLATTLDRLQREVGRCQGPSRYRSELEEQIASTQFRRQEVLDGLLKPLQVV